LNHDDVFNYNDFREFISDYIGNESYRSFAQKHNNIFSYARLSQLLKKDSENSYKWPIILSNEKFYMFLKDIGLSPNQRDYLLFLKIKNDTDSNDVKKSIKKALKNLYLLKKDKDYARYLSFTKETSLIAEAFSLLSKKRKLDAIREMLTLLEIEENRSSNKNQLSKINKIIKNLSSI
jgi:hypothetical protein